MTDEKKQGEALAALGDAMKRWGVKPEQLKSPYRELMSGFDLAAGPDFTVGLMNGDRVVSVSDAIAAQPGQCLYVFAPRGSSPAPRCILWEAHEDDHLPIPDGGGEPLVNPGSTPEAR